MAYMAKLSHRLARMKRAASVLAIVALAATCERASTSPTGPGSRVAQLVVSPESVTLNPSQQLQFAAYGRTTTGDSSALAVTWAATGGVVTPTGQYTADTTAGDYVVTATSAVYNLSASAHAHVKPKPVASVTVSPTSVTVLAGQTAQLSATPKDASGNPLSGRVITWATSNAALATVSTSGLVTAIAAGSATITATSEGQSGTAAVTVSVVPVASVSVSPATASLTVGQTAQLTATPKDASGNPLTGRVVTWATSNAAVATVSTSGLVTAVGAGSATITATSEGQSGTAAITATQVPVASVVVSPATATLTVGQTTQLSATPKDASGNPLTGRVITWATSNAAVATVSTSGLVTAVGAGSATITATSEGQSGTAAVTVSVVPVASVSVSPATASLTVGQTSQLTATPKDASGNPLTGRVITWATSNAAVATVNASGLVTAVLAGSATITATSEGKSATAGITVTTGGTVLFQESFADTAFAARGWYDNTHLAITDTVHSTGATSALEVHFLAGATGPAYGGAARHLFTATPTLYVSYWVKYSANWVGSGQTYHPHEFNVLSNLDGTYDGPANNYLSLYIEDNYQNGGIPRLAMQDNKEINTSYGTPPINLVGVTENRSTAGCNGVVETNLFSECYNSPPWYNDKHVDAAQPYFLPTPGPGYKGNWNQVEAYFQLNSIVGGVGQANGVMQYWVNGALVIDRHDILYRTGARPTIAFNQFLMAFYIGSGSPVDQTLWIDGLTVATAKP